MSAQPKHQQPTSSHTHNKTKLPHTQPPTHFQVASTAAHSPSHSCPAIPPLTPAETRLAAACSATGWTTPASACASAPGGCRPSAWPLPLRPHPLPRLQTLPRFLRPPQPERARLIHELAHVWQHQNGFPVWLGGLLTALRGGYLKQRAYRLPHLAAVPHLSRLNMEQQAEIFALYYRAAHCREPAIAPLLPHLQRLLHPFFQNPASRTLRPRWC
ncbi:hypothetical protein [Eikenella sp. Marseille-P7795]|uniref:hypothetical protein n=1 Tax=Eikenella sp. Marseille-P7795 TaxID=2866577 RepID=UPI001CE44A3A|nr:hypothetical protein [Eikenella sp. Marseille-P7795]